MDRWWTLRCISRFFPKADYDTHLLVLLHSLLICFHPCVIFLTFIMQNKIEQLFLSRVLLNISGTNIWCLDIFNRFSFLYYFVKTNTFPVFLFFFFFFCSSNLFQWTHSVLFKIQRCSPGVREAIEMLDACRQDTLGKRKKMLSA